MLGTLYLVLFFQAYINMSKQMAKGARSNDTVSYVYILVYIYVLTQCINCHFNTEGHK